jgi:hypothetical protein
METTILKEINASKEALKKLSINLSDRRSLDYLLENFTEDELKKEFISFSKDFLISTLENEIELQKRYKRKLGTFDELIKYLIKNVCSKDQLRPAMCTAFYDKDQKNIVATDALILAALSIKNLPISDKIENITSYTGDVYLSNYCFNSFKIDKYGDILNEDLENKYPDYNAIYPEINYLDYPYFSINPLLFNGLKTLNKIAKKLRIKRMAVKLDCLENKAFLSLSLLVRYIDLHQKLYGNYSYIHFTRNSNNESSILYNIDLLSEFKLLIMPVYGHEFNECFDLNL